MTPVNRITQDAYMDVSGRTTQEIKSSGYRGAEALPTGVGKGREQERKLYLQEVGKERKLCSPI
jgi:hypothetical protein